MRYGASKLAAQADVSVATVNNAKNPDHDPYPTTAYSLAVAAGCSEGIALEIAKECAAKSAKESA